MMKKLLALLLAVMMALACTVSLAEEEAPASDKVDIGTISINGAFALQCGLPEGYGITPVYADQSQVIALMEHEDKTQPRMVLSVAFDETYADVDRMNDLDQETFELLEKTYTDVDPEVEISYGETGLGTRLMIVRFTDQENDYIDFLSIYKGYFVEFVMTAGEEAEDKNLSDEQLQLCIEFLTDLDFVPTTTPQGTWMDSAELAGKTVPANVTYNRNRNELIVTVKEPVVVPVEEAEALTVGSTVAAGVLDIEVEKVEKEYEGSIDISDDAYLVLREDGYHIYRDQLEAQIEVGQLTVPLTDAIVLVDQIDPVMGEVLEEDATRTAEEFKALLNSNDAIRFDEDNVTVTFDVEGNLVKVYRFYTPWQ